MSYTGLIAHRQNFSHPHWKMKENIDFLMNSYSIVKYRTLVPIILSTSIVTALKH